MAVIRDVTLDEDSLTVMAGERSVRLLPKEFLLLQFLMEHPGRTFTREDLLEAVWPMEEPVDRTVDDHVYRLRKKLAVLPIRLETVRGRGYRLQFAARLTTAAASADTPADHPILKNEDYRRHVRELFRTYILHGQGQGIKTMADAPQVFGLHSDVELDLMARFFRGDFQPLIEEDITFPVGADEGEANQPQPVRLYLMLELYRTVQFDYQSSLAFAEAALRRNLLNEEDKLDIVTFDLAVLSLFSGQTQRAYQLVADAVESVEAMPDFFDGFMPLIRIQDTMFAVYAKRIEEARRKLVIAQETLTSHPWQRETAFLRIVEGMLRLLEGDEAAGEANINEGLQRLDEIGFIPYYIGRIHDLLYFFDEVHSARRLRKKYTQIWEGLSTQYDFPRLAEKLDSMLSKFLL